MISMARVAQEDVVRRKIKNTAACNQFELLEAFECDRSFLVTEDVSVQVLEKKAYTYEGQVN